LARIEAALITATRASPPMIAEAGLRRLESSSPGMGRAGSGITAAVAGLVAHPLVNQGVLRLDLRAARRIADG